MRARFFIHAALGVALLTGLMLGPTPSLAAPAEPLELNSATADALTAIPGIGTVMADRIVSWRNEHGPFRRVEDLMKVKGIGEKLFEKIRPYVKVGKSR